MKILFVAGHEFLHNPQNGGQKCSLRNFTLLKNIVGKENIYLFLFSNYNDQAENVYTFPTQKNRVELLINTISGRNVCNKKTEKKVIETAKTLKFDLVFADSSTIGCLTDKICQGKPIITFFHNIEKRYAWNKVKHDGILYLVAYFSYSKNEKKAVEISNKLIFLNERDSNLAQMLYGKQADLYLPISFEDTFDESQIFEKEYQGFTLLFVGSLFGPNIEGITWFSKEVMSKLPTEIQLIVVGKGLETKKNQIERENVEVIGTVDDVGEYYYKADAVIIPIFYGDGMKVKTAEALMYGKELFASNEALEGYSVERIPEVHRCNTADDFINAICGVMEKKEKKKYYKSVRDIFLQNYETNRLKNSLEEFLSDMVDKGCQYAD